MTVRKIFRRRKAVASEFPVDPPPRPPVMAEGATWPSGAVAPFPAALFNAVAVAIVGAIPPDDACLADENECFDRHPVHLGWSVDGTARTVYAKVDGLVEIVLAAVVPLIRAQLAAKRRCPLCNPGSPEEIRQREEASAELDRLIVYDDEDLPPGVHRERDGGEPA